MPEAFNCVLAWVNLADGASLTGGGAVSTLPVQNLQDPQPRKLYRTIGTSAYAIADFGSPQPFDVVGATATNLSAGGTSRVRASNSDPTVTSSLIYDSSTDGAAVKIGPDPRYLGNVFTLPSSQQTARYVREDLTDVTLANIDWGRWFVGAKFVPNATISEGYGFGFDDTGAQGRAVFGQLHTRKGQRPRQCSLKLDFLSAAEAKAEMLEMQRQAGVTGDVLYIENPVDATNPAAMAFIGLVQAGSSSALSQLGQSKGNGLELIINTTYPIFSISIDLAERL